MGQTKKNTGSHQQEPEVTFLRQDEVTQLSAVMKEKRECALLRLAYHHGLRASKVGWLQRTDVDVTNLAIITVTYARN